MLKARPCAARVTRSRRASPYHPPRADIGVSVAVLALLIFLFIKPSLDNDKQAKAKDAGDGDEEALGSSLLGGNGEEDVAPAAGGGGKSWVDALSPATRTAAGLGMSVISGML